MGRALVGVLVVFLVAPLRAQVPLDRTPNLGGTWVPVPGVLQFNFLHRFYVAPSAGGNGVVNFPTFTFAQGLPGHLAVGVQYATRSDIDADASNEFEVFGRWQVLHDRGPIRVTVVPAYNLAAESFDGEIAADWTRGAVTALGAARAMSNAFHASEFRVALAGGVVLRLNSYVALAGDAATLLDTKPGEDPAWSAGLLFGIPGSPHLLSLHASNVGATTIEASSRRSPLVRAVTSKPLIGFAFTIPIHLKRFAPWFGGGDRDGNAAAGRPAAATVRIAQLAFQTATVRIAVGQSVRWVNDDEVTHTVTFVDGGASSRELARGRGFTRTFDRPGTYEYHCTPHPFMRGVVVVQ